MSCASNTQSFFSSHNDSENMDWTPLIRRPFLHRCSERPIFFSWRRLIAREMAAHEVAIIPFLKCLKKYWRWCSSSPHCLFFIHNKKSKWFLIAVRHMPPFRGKHSFSQKKNQCIKTNVFFSLQARDPVERRTRRRTGVRVRRWPSPAGPARSSRSSGPTTADSPSPSATSMDTQTGPSTAWAQEPPESYKLSK